MNAEDADIIITKSEARTILPILEEALAESTEREETNTLVNLISYLGTETT